METNDIIERVLNKIDSLDDKLASIDKTLAKQETNLELHMKRSDHLETLIELQSKRLEPVERHVSNVTFLIKIVAGLIAIGGTIVGIIQGLN